MNANPFWLELHYCAPIQTNRYIIRLGSYSSCRWRQRCFCSHRLQHIAWLCDPFPTRPVTSPARHLSGTREPFASSGITPLKSSHTAVITSGSERQFASDLMRSEASSAIPKNCGRIKIWGYNHVVREIMTEGLTNLSSRISEGCGGNPHLEALAEH